MRATLRAVGLLRVLLVLAFAALVVAQTWLVPVTLADQAEQTPELAYLRWPVLAFVVMGLLCVQVVIVCTWRLLTMVKDDRIFSERSMAWVDAIVWAIVAAWVLLFGMFLLLALTWGDPGVPVLLLFLLIGVAVLGLLMVVMRALLRQATTLRADMETVI
jgi:hypothetical protein